MCSIWGQKVWKPYFSMGFIYTFICGKRGAKGGKSPLSFWKQQPRKQFFASLLFTLLWRQRPGRFFRCITLQQRCMVLSKLMGDHKKAPPLQGRADFCTHLYAVWVHWFMRVFAHFSRDALKCTHPWFLRAFACSLRASFSTLKRLFFKRFMSF